MYVAQSVMTGNLPPDMPSFLPAYIPYEITSVSPSTGSTISRLTSLAPSKDTHNKTGPAPLPPPSSLLTATIATPFKILHHILPWSKIKL